MVSTSEDGGHYGKRDHAPCPFGPIYQLARNVMAAAVEPDGRIDGSRGHALVIYDSRNPSFRAGGRADRQWASALRAIREPGLLRRVSWQSLVAHLNRQEDFDWLVEGLEAKYGLVTNGPRSEEPIARAN